MPNIGFRLKNFMKYNFDPVDYLSTPIINKTTNTPYCNLGIIPYWDNDGVSGSSYLNNAGFGSIFAVKFGFYGSVNRASGEMIIGFLKG